MTLAGGVLIALLIVVVVLALAVVWLWQDRKDMKAKIAQAMSERDVWRLEVAIQKQHAATVAKVEEKRNEQKDKVAAGGFDASVSVLSDIAKLAHPKT